LNAPNSCRQAQWPHL